MVLTDGLESCTVEQTAGRVVGVHETSQGHLCVPLMAAFIEQVTVINNNVDRYVM